MVEKYARDPAKEQGSYKIANFCTMITVKHISMFIIKRSASLACKNRY